MPDNKETPPPKTTESGRVTVTLSSVAKTPPPLSAVVAPPKDPALSGAIPSAQETKRAAGHPQLNRTMEVKLPPKSGVLPKLTTLASMPLAPASVPALKEETTPRKKRGLFRNLRLRPFRLGGTNPEESIFPNAPAKETMPGPSNVPAPTPAVWKHLEPGELPVSSETSRVFERIPGAPEEKSLEVPPLPLPKTAPPLPPAQPTTPPPLAPVTPPPIPSPFIPALPATATPPPLPFPVAPPLVEPQREEKLRPPPLPKLSSALKSDFLAPAVADSFILSDQSEKKKPAQPELPVIAPPLEAKPLPVSPLFAAKPKIEEKKQVTEPPPPVPAARKGSAKNPAPFSPAPAKTDSSRSARKRKRRLIGTITFYALFLGLVIPFLFVISLHVGSETRVEGQVIPPTGTMLCDEVWIVTDFRSLASGVADDLAAERAPKLQEVQERQDHVQRAQADIAAREERIRLLQEQIQAAKDEIASSVKQSHDAAQRVWDGPGAALEDDYKAKLNQLQTAIAARAKSLNLKYAPDDTYQSPEVWANAYRLALYQTPPGVDGTKEHQWIEDQLNQWRAFTKSFDDRREKLRLQAAQIQLSPGAHIADINAKIDDLQHRVDSTQAEEDPLKTELQQAQADLAQSQGAESTLDAKYYQQLYALPESSINKRLPLRPNGRFSWPHLEKDNAFSQGEKNHAYWIFARAVRNDGRQYWVLAHFAISQNTTLPILIEPASFVSTKTILRPDLSSEEQQQ
jgi:hypothetical protein